MTATAKKISLKLSKNDMIALKKEEAARRADDEKRKQERIKAAKWIWKKLGNLAYQYIYERPSVFGEGAEQVSAENLAKLLARTGAVEIDNPDSPTQYRLSEKLEEWPSVDEVADLYTDYMNLDVEDEKPTRRSRSEKTEESA